jgi:flagellar biosynthetic protein FlhB
VAETPAQERTESPTNRRLTQAHDEGQVPRSTELSAAVVVLGGATALLLLGGRTLGAGMTGLMHDSTRMLVAAPFTQGDVVVLLRNAGQVMLKAMAPFLLAIVIPALLVNGIQARGVLSLKPIAPDFSRINPASGLARLLSGQSLFTLIKAMIKVTIIGTVGWLAMSRAWPEIVSLSGADAATILVVVRDVTVKLVFGCGLAFLALALVDYGYATWQHQKRLRMTRQEVIQEFRELEGDPIRKSRMRSLAQGLVRRRMLHRVKEADVVIVNPTEIAIAIRYDGTSPAPIVLAMGRRKLAERIREIARLANIPVVQNIPVARALIATAAVGKPIPPALYVAVAEVLAFVYRKRGHLPRALTERTVA